MVDDNIEGIRKPSYFYNRSFSKYLRDLLLCVDSQNKENLKEDEEIIAENYDESERSHKKESVSNSSRIHNSTYDNEDLKAHIEAKFKVSIIFLIFQFLIFKIIW